jgi:hypothetical protein
MDIYSQFFDICAVLAGVYMLYSAFTGKGSLLENSKVKKGMEEKYKTLILRFCWVTGFVAIATGIFDYFRLEPYATITFVLFALLIVYLVVMTIRYTERK